MSRWFRGLMWVGVGLFVALLLMWRYVDWAGKRSWAAVQEMLAHEGESLDFLKIAAAAPPDEQNFCAIPPLKDLVKTGGSPDAEADRAFKFLNPKDYVLPPKLTQGALLGQATDMAAWAAWLRREGSLPMPPDSGDPARDVLAALSRDDALFGELALGLNRPESQWTRAWRTPGMPGPYFGITYSQEGRVKQLLSMLCLRSAAAARAGDAAKAHQSLLIALRLSQANIQEPLLLGCYIASLDSGMICSSVWELCDAHSGAADDFRRLQESLARLDYQKSLLYATREEEAYAADMWAYMKSTRDARILDPFARPAGVERASQSLLMHLIPDGLFDANAATFAEWYFDYYIKPLRDAGFRQFLVRQKELRDLMTEHKSHPFQHLDETIALIAMPGVSGVVSRAVYAQCLVNEAIAACALERYRIEHQSYPDSLEAANRAGERSIPLDVISGKPMGYRKTPDGRYALWCVGLDGKDDGGKRGPDPTGTQAYDPRYRGDWVWDFPAK
jgi:hypothetical protein